VSISFGGVARNVAECMTRLGAQPQFVSVRGDDVVWAAVVDPLIEEFCNGFAAEQIGEALANDCNSFGLACDDIMVSSSHSTAVYTALCQSSGELEMAGVSGRHGPLSCCPFMCIA
jgi:sugar/nucleoside kinase (ribokinase family)